jgi:hypothetical protein
MQVQLGENHGCSTEQVQFAYKCAIRVINETDENSTAESAYAKRTRLITSLFAQKFGGDWVCLMGKQDEKEGSVFSYYVPSIRYLYFLVGRKHFVHVAQIFEPHAGHIVLPRTK